MNFCQQDSSLNHKPLARFIDHTCLKPTATAERIESLCREAIEYNFAAVCINPIYVKYAIQMLKDADIAVCTVVGFPLGANLTEVKAFETENALNDGAAEIDMMMNIGAFKGGDFQLVEKDIFAIRRLNDRGILKVIIETCYLDSDEKLKACEIIRGAGADFIKTSTGFGPSGATIDDVKLLKDAANGRIKIKAAGGIKTRAAAEALIAAGADRLGTSSSVAIIRG
jgi:deoxyribose-phosphate aldolase